MLPPLCLVSDMPPSTKFATVGVEHARMPGPPSQVPQVRERLVPRIVPVLAFAAVPSDAPLRAHRPPPTAFALASAAIAVSNSFGLRAGGMSGCRRHGDVSANEPREGLM